MQQFKKNTNEKRIFGFVKRGNVCKKTQSSQVKPGDSNWAVNPKANLDISAVIFMSSTSRTVQTQWSRDPKWIQIEIRSDFG
jgi:hypothetical protein